ncbi:MAG: TetR/AcrR family transcriptional regulator [Micromonosporaceae bacterium]
MSQRIKAAGPANAIGEQRVLDAAYQLLLTVGPRRMTMADIGRQAKVSRATLYRRWPNVRSVIGALVTREWADMVAACFHVGSGSGRERLVAGVVEAVSRSREHPLLRAIVRHDPEFLLPYLLERRGSSTEDQLAAVETGLRAGHADGSIRAGDPRWQARSLMLTAISFAITGPIMAGADDYDRLDAELRTMLDRYLAPDPA